MLTHTPSAVAVFQTREYKNFIFIKGNRPLNLKKIAKIIKEIESGNDMLQYYPIQARVVDNALQILDGQHRFHICRKLQRPVHYILVHEERTMVDIAKVNSNVEKWTTTNFINCYKLAGYKSYEIVEQMMNEFGFSLGITLSLLTCGDPGPQNGGLVKLHAAFEDGSFVALTEESARQFGNVCKKFESFAHWRSRNFVVAIQRILQAEKIAIADLIAVWEKNKDMLVQQANFKDYIICLEKIINIGKKHRIIIT